MVEFRFENQRMTQNKVIAVVWSGFRMAVNKPTA